MSECSSHKIKYLCANIATTNSFYILGDEQHNKVSSMSKFLVFSSKTVGETYLHKLLLLLRFCSITMDNVLYHKAMGAECNWCSYLTLLLHSLITPEKIVHFLRVFSVGSFLGQENSKNFTKAH